ncbi:MAG: sigma-70 family RNA polymerase sigma factor [Tunicatimonas sp.]
MRSNDREKAFGELYQTYHDMVFHLCLGFMKGDTDAAHDVSQEVFINCWRAIDQFRGQASHKTWVYRITVNTCLQHLRGQRKHQRAPLSDHEQLAAPPPASANPYQDLYQAIGQLGEVDRLVIMLVLDELSYQEIAQITGLAAGTLRVRIHRIKKSLRKLLDHERTQ